MWVFGDGEITMDGGEATERLVVRWHGAESAGAGIARHAELVSLLVEVGMLAQGVADEADARGAPDDRAAAILRAGSRVARAIDQSRATRGTEGRLGAPHELLALLASGARSRPVRARIPEGYAFYALYPELYSEAARRFAARHGGRAFVIGVRSIGTSLACSVGAALHDVRGVSTVRPGGAPFEREATLPRRLVRAVASERCPVLVVDEGPGLSGSTLSSVADALEAGGVARPRIHFVPAHEGALGPRAGLTQRARWESTPKHVASFEDTLVNRCARWPLSSWFEPVVGPTEALDDIGGGAWRARVFEDERAYPPANVLLERRKYLLGARTGHYLLKFAGIGPWAAAHERRARWLAGTGLVPPVVARAHGFLATRWREGVPLSAIADRALAEVADTLAAYLDVLRSQPTGGRGASPAVLLQMAARNTELSLGHRHARELRRFEPIVASVAADARPVAIDGKMHAWEWLVSAEGVILKTDAFDHHAGHDLVGCQDLAWDVAGALVELARTQDERALLLAALGRRGIRVEAAVRRFYEVCYLAFQLGSAATAAEMLAGRAPHDALRFGEAAASYAARLERLLHAP